MGSCLGRPFEVLPLKGQIMTNLTRKALWIIAVAILIATIGAGCNERDTADKADSPDTTAPADRTAPQSPDQTDDPAQAADSSTQAAPAEAPKPPTQVKLETTQGDIVIRLDEAMAPITCKNFLRYVKDGFYDGTIFHRVIKDFMIQGGGFTADMMPKSTHEPITNESNNGLKNTRGAVAMARTQDIHSATSQFFINHRDNPSLDAGGPFGGYAVFGHVVSGMDVVDAIAALPTKTVGRYQNVPVEPVIIKRAIILE